MEDNIQDMLRRTIFDLEAINQQIEAYNDSDDIEDKELESFLESEQKRLLKLISKKALGNNVSLLLR